MCRVCAACVWGVMRGPGTGTSGPCHHLTQDNIGHHDATFFILFKGFIQIYCHQFRDRIAVDIVCVAYLCIIKLVPGTVSSAIGPRLPRPANDFPWRMYVVAERRWWRLPDTVAGLHTSTTVHARTY